MTAARSAWFPLPDALDLVGELPAGVEAVVWNGRGDPPAASGPVFWVPPFPRVDYAAVAASVPTLEVVQMMTAGFEHAAAALPPGIALTNARGVHNTSVAEWIVAAILSSLRRFPEIQRAQLTGETLQAHGGVLRGSRVMILGYGSIGETLAPLLDAFGAEVVKVARRARDGVHGVDEMPGLLPKTDILVVLAPANSTTERIVDRAVLTALPDGALVVNASRGVLIDQGALIEQLSSGRVRAALDVADPDPLPPAHPLLASPGVLYTPHVSGMTDEKLPSVFRYVGAQLRRWAAGEPLENIVLTRG